MCKILLRQLSRWDQIKQKNKEPHKEAVTQMFQSEGTLMRRAEQKRTVPKL